jgi:hypothetical protein
MMTPIVLLVYRFRTMAVDCIPVEEKGNKKTKFNVPWEDKWFPRS